MKDYSCDFFFLLEYVFMAWFHCRDVILIHIFLSDNHSVWEMTCAFFDCSFLCKFSFSEFVEGREVPRDLPTSRSSLLCCFCSVVKWKLAFWDFLTIPPPLSPFHLHLLFPFPLLSLSCSVLLTFLSVFSCVPPSREGGLAGRSGGLREAVQLALLQLLSHRFSCSSQIRPAHFPGTTGWLYWVLLLIGSPHSFPLHFPSQVPITLRCWAVGTLTLSTCFWGLVEKSCHPVLSHMFVCFGFLFTCSVCFMWRFWKIQNYSIDITAILPEFLY